MTDSSSMLEDRKWHRHNGQLTLPERVEAVLQSLPTVVDCVVVAQQTELIVYVVPLEILIPGELDHQLRSRMAEPLPAVQYVAVSALPLGEDGRIDRLALQRLTVLDSDLARRWEHHLRSLEGIDDAAVLRQSRPQKLPPLHLADLLPQWSASSPETDHLPLPAPAIHASTPAHLLSAPAFADGGTLPKPDDGSFPSTLVELLPWAAAHFPDHGFTFLLADKSERHQTYPQLLVHARCILTALRSRSITPHTPVLLLLDQPEQLVPAFWGCVLGGFVPLIVSVPPSFEQANSQLDKLLHLTSFLSQPPIICNRASETVLKRSLPGSSVLVFEQLDDHPPADTFFLPSPETVALLNLTSGSTGTPKCIPLTHRNLLARARGANLLCEHSSEDILLNWLPFEHIGSISDWHIRGIVAGCRMVYLQKETVLAAPLSWLDLIDRYQISHSWAPNFAYGLVNQALRQHSSRSWNLRSLKMLLSAGETVAASTVEEFYSHLHCCGLARTVLRPAFGMAEVASGITYFQPTQDTPLTVHRLDKAALDNGLAVIPETGHTSTIELIDLGRPIAGMQLRVVDEHNHLLTQRQVGRLQLRGEAVFSGYLQNPQATAAVLLSDGWFDTGDLAFLDNGHLVLVGRHKETIILNGANYYSHDIEQLVESVEGVEASFTAACAVRAEGNATEKLAIFLVAKAGIEPAELLASVRQQVVQKLGVEVEHLLLVEKGDIPKTSIGKIQRRQLQKRMEAGEFLSLQKRMDVLQNNQRTIGDWFYSKQWRQRVLEVSDKEPKGAVLVFVDDSGLGSILKPHLEECVQVEAGEGFQKLGKGHYRLNPTSVEQYGQLLGSVESEGLHLRHILHLWGCRPYRQPQSASDLLRAQETGLQSVLALVQALAAMHDGYTELALRVVTNHLQAVLPGDPIDCAGSTVLGLLRSLDQELPWLDCRHIDLPVEEGEHCRDALLAELVSGRGEREVAYRQGRRWVARLQKVDMVAQVKQPVPFQKGGFYLLTGGLSGIGRSVAKQLLSQYQARLLFVQPTIEKEQREALAALMDSGAEVIAREIDLTNLCGLQEAVEGAKQRWGRHLDGVLHLEQPYRESLVVEETPEQLARFLYPQLQTSWTLHQLLAGQPVPGFFLRIAHASGELGGIVAAGFAAAQSFASAFVQYQRQAGLQNSYCFSFGFWEDFEPGRDYPWRPLAAARGYRFLSRREGWHSLLAALAQGTPSLVAGIDGRSPAVRPYCLDDLHPLEQLTAYYSGETILPSTLQAIPDRFGRASSCNCMRVKAIPRQLNGQVEEQALIAQQSHSRRESVTQAAPQEQVARTIAAVWQQVLQVDRVGLDDSFFDLGGHSILLVQVQQQLQQVLGRQIALLDLFTYPTVGTLAQFLKQGEAAQSPLRQEEQHPEVRQLAIYRQRQLRRQHRQSRQGQVR
ncbi:AMP-dependent synthetase and ligase [Gloeobacter kilaueensis JS1]|uniref:AMP-dependent synthetase and ligase n=2 Tax=Gloeobacter TaxID=33071 RepID=U5QGL8_GLOK1|nr:AMP-dependent synthetase and ligase [Gloeobacter kilaueensis JS1]